MKILFVTGPSFSGKSIYIRKEYSDATVVNLNVFKKVVECADSNEELEELAKNSYLYCREALKNTIRSAGNDDTVILEAQLLSKQARAFFLEAVKEVTDTPVECVLMSPDENKICELLADHPTLISLHQYERNKMENPSIDEGFAEVTVVFPEFEDTDWSQIVKKN